MNAPRPNAPAVLVNVAAKPWPVQAGRFNDRPYRPATATGREGQR